MIFGNSRQGHAPWRRRQRPHLRRPGQRRLYGGPGDDELRPDAGNDRVYGGPGNDTIHAFGGGDHDYVDCGPGNDTAYVDKGEQTRRCERVKHR